MTSPLSSFRSAGRAALFAAALCAFLAALPEPEAQAQYTNNAIGFQAGYLHLDKSLGARGGPALGIESTLYLSNGFDLMFRLLVGIHQEISSGDNRVGLFPAVGFRYLISEESLRPYVGLSIAYLQFLNASEGSALTTRLRIAVAPTLGLEYFVSSNFAIGIQGEYQRILVLNGDDGNAYGLLGRISWGF